MVLYRAMNPYDYEYLLFLSSMCHENESLVKNITLMFRRKIT